MEGRTSNFKVDLSKYVEEGSDKDGFSNWDDIELPESGLSLSSLGRKEITMPSIPEQQTDYSDFSDATSYNEIKPTLPTHVPSLDNVNRFLSNYTGPGTVTRLSGSKRPVSSEHSDWDEDIVIPKNGFLRISSNRSFVDDIDSFFKNENDPVPSRASTISRFSSLNSLAERSEEDDFSIPDGKLKLKLSPHRRDVPLELNFDGDDTEAGSSSNNVKSPEKESSKFFPSVTPESSTENWDDIAFPESMDTLKLVQRKPYRPSVQREENWLEDLEIPNDNVFTIKAEQNRLLKRKTTAPAARILTRNTIKLDLFNLPHMASQPSNNNRPYSRKALRQKCSSDNFSKRGISINQSPLSPPSPSSHDNQFSRSNSNPTPLVRSKVQFYSDGTELDDLDNLPVPAETEIRRNSNKIQRLNPPKTEGSRESYSSLLSQFSEIDVQPSPKSEKGQRKPHLIKNLNSLKVERYVGEMRFNPRTNNWEGNDQALKDFDAISPPRPALITNLNGSKRPRRVGNMIFDPEQMKWCSIVEEDDPFASIPDLTTADPQIDPEKKNEASGNSFYLNAKFINSMYDAERQHRQFMSRWSNDSTRSSASRTTYGHQNLSGSTGDYDHLFDIRSFPTDF